MATGRPKKLKGYVHPNLDGRVRGMVAAYTLAEAAKALRSTTYDMRNMGWYEAQGEALALAVSKPGTVFYGRTLGDPEWTTDRDSLRNPR